MTVRPVHGRAGNLRRQLSQRDLAVLRSLHELRLLSLRQLQRLHVVDGSVKARTRRAQLLTKRLHDLDLVVRLSRVIGGVRAGSAGFIYGLSGVGQAVLAVGGPHGRRRRVWDTKPYFQDHMLAVSELFVGLVELEGLSDAELLTFDGEPRCWRHFSGSGGELVVVKPDAYVRIGLGEFERRWFVEVDLATEGLATIRRKCLRYVAYWRSGIEQQRGGVFPLITWLVPNVQRKDHLSDVVQRLPADTHPLFQVELASAGPRLLTSPATEWEAAA